MISHKTITLLGGDGRIGQIADKWAKEGNAIRTFGVNRKGQNEASVSAALRDADVVVLPVPVTRDGVTLNAPFASKSVRLDELKAAIPSGARVLSGGPFDGAVDYANTDVFQTLNAVPTAEGAIGIAIENTPRLLAGSEILVVGAGRIGKILAQKLKNLDATVTVSARKEKDFALLKAMGLRAVKTDEIALSAKRYDVVFNTVPAPVIGKAFLQKTKADVLIVDLASMPGGTDFEEAERLHVRAVRALGLPGKTAPETAAEILRSVLETEIIKGE